MQTSTIFRQSNKLQPNARQQVLAQWHKLHLGTLATRKYCQNEDIDEALRPTVLASVKVCRERLRNISWFMKDLNEYIARELFKTTAPAASPPKDSPPKVPTPPKDSPGSKGSTPPKSSPRYRVKAVPKSKSPAGSPEIIAPDAAALAAMSASGLS